MAVKQPRESALVPQGVKEIITSFCNQQRFRFKSRICQAVRKKAKKRTSQRNVSQYLSDVNWMMRQQNSIPGRKHKESNLAIKNLSFNVWSKTGIRRGYRWKRHDDKEHKALKWTSEPSTFDAIRVEATSFCLHWQENFCFALFFQHRDTLTSIL